MFNHSGDPTHLIELMYTVRDQPSRKQDQQNARHLEEAAQVQADRGGKESPTEQGGGTKTQNRASQRLNDVAGHLALIASEECSSNEECKLNTLPNNCHKSKPEHCTLASGCSSFIDTCLQFAFEETGLFA